MQSKGGLLALVPILYSGRAKKEPRDSGPLQTQKLPSFALLRLLLGVPVGVHRRELLPLLRKIFQRENRGHRAHRDASAAINTFHWIDKQHRFALVGRLVLARVDAVHRTHINTWCGFGGDGRFGNHIRHANSPLLRVAGRGQLTNATGDSPNKLALPGKSSIKSILRGTAWILNQAGKARMEVRGNDMKLRFALAGLVVIAKLSLGAAQTAAPKDPALLDTHGSHKL